MASRKSGKYWIRELRNQCMSGPWLCIIFLRNLNLMLFWLALPLAPISRFRDINAWKISALVTVGSTFFCSVKGHQSLQPMMDIGSSLFSTSSFSHLLSLCSVSSKDIPLMHTWWPSVYNSYSVLSKWMAGFFNCWFLRRRFFLCLWSFSAGVPAIF